MNDEEPWCDWCGEPFKEGEKPVEGYGYMPTHRKCQREALKVWANDGWPYSRSEVNEPKREREPFGNWPNGQGTYD